MKFDLTHTARRARTKLGSGILLASTAMLLAACDREPEGQVVAVVNGDEITQQELNSALGDRQLPEGEAAESVRNSALETVINRRLLAEAAREAGIDATPEFIVKRREVEEALLVQLLSQSIAKDLPQPSPEEIDTFISSNPQMFANRAVMAVDQIRFSAPNRNDYLEALADVASMDQAVAVLNRLGIQFERGNTRIDSMSMPRELFEQVRAVGSREPIIVPGQVTTVSQILQTQQAPVTGEAARPLALDSLRRQAVGDALRQRLDQAKENAGIDYQPGFGPVAEGGAGAAGSGTVDRAVDAAVAPGS